MEREYRWLEAARLYDQMISASRESGHQVIAKLAERSGHAVYKAAMQSETSTEFQKLVTESIDAYARAAESYESGGELDRVLGMRCRAMMDYLRFWQLKDIADRKRVLDSSWDLSCKVLDSLDGLDEKLEYGRTFNLLCWPGFYGATLTPNTPLRTQRIKRAIQHGERAVVFFSGFGDKDEESRAAANTSCFCEGTGYWLVDDPEEERLLFAKAKSYWSRASEVSENAALLAWVVIAVIPGTYVGWVPGSKTIVEKLEALLEFSRKTGDLLVQASVLNWLGFNLMWATRSALTREEAGQQSEAIIRFAEEADEKFGVLGIASSLENPKASSLAYLAETETDPLKKRSLLENAIRAARADIARNREYGHPIGINYSEYHLSRCISTLASLTDSSSERRALLEESLAYYASMAKFFADYCPVSEYDEGFAENRIASTRHSLALMIQDPKSRQAILRQAMDGLKRGIDLCQKGLPHLEAGGHFGIFDELGQRQTELGETLIELSEISADEGLVQEAIEAFDASVESFERMGTTSRISESLWRSANANASLGNHLKASECFLAASKAYGTVAENNPQLRRFYEDYRDYMSACAEIESARDGHRQLDHGMAQKHYASAAKILESVERWKSIAPNYLALASMEQGELFSREEKNNESIRAFKEAEGLLTTVIKTTSAESTNIENIRSALFEAQATAVANKQYCKGRMLLEKARWLGKQGQYASSSELFEKAAMAFENVRVQQGLGRERDEIQALAIASKAYRSMLLAESEGSAGHFADASALFDSARAVCHNERLAMLMAGHSSFCKALESGTKFVAASDPEYYMEAIAKFDMAAGYYAKAGLTIDSEYAEASKLFFDGYSFLVKAHHESGDDDLQKLKDYASAEKTLLASAALFGKSGFTGKESEVLRLAEKVTNEKTLALSLVQIFDTPRIASITGAVTIPNLNLPAVGLEAFEHAMIEASARIDGSNFDPGGNVRVVLSLGNVGKNPARLLRLQGLFSDDFAEVIPSTGYAFSNSDLDLNGKSLKPLETIQLDLVLRSRSSGVFTLNPVLLYANERSQISKLQMGPVDVIVSRIADFLLRCFADDYLGKRLSRDHAGWRSLMEVVHGLKGPRSQVYGDQRYGHTFSNHLESLIAKKIVEHRTFPGERGRGGKIIRIRACYDTDVVRRLIERNESPRLPAPVLQASAVAKARP